MSVLSESDQGTVSGLSDAGHLRTKKDKNGNVINGNQQQMIWAARRQGQMKARVSEAERHEKDAAFMAAWAPGSAANSTPSPSYSFYDAAKVVAVLAQTYNVVSENNVHHLNPQDVLNEHSMMKYLERHLDEVA